MSDLLDPPRRVIAGQRTSEPTVRIVEKPAETRTDARRTDTDNSNTVGITGHDSRLIRIHDGQLVPVLEPRPGQLPEDRYKHAPAGKCELGEGAIGQVSLVFDSVLGREVAMKVLREEYASSGGAINEAAWRFLREARVTGQLEHPNIVPVHELGCRADGTVYYTMRVVRGRTLGDALKKASSLKQRLSLLHHFTDVCQAIAYAHSRGVLHRDIKPSNVMIGEFGETFVLDWGLARVTASTQPMTCSANLSLPPADYDVNRANIRYDDHEHTTLGGIVGTPLYMSPEQVAGDHQNLDARSDVWSLGVVLYIILTGRSPFAADTLADVLTRVLSKEIPLPVTLEPGVPLELQAIAMRALMRDKAARYNDAGEMAKDMTAYQSGERVDAYAYGFVDLARRFLVRYRAAAMVSAIAFFTIVSLAVLSYLRVTHARDRALVAERRATAGQQLANSRYADSLVEKSRTAAAMDDVIEAEMLATEASSIESRPDARGILLSLSGSVRLARTVQYRSVRSCTLPLGVPGDAIYTCVAPSMLNAFQGSALKWSIDVPGAVSATSVGEHESAVLSDGGHWSVYSNDDGRLIAAGKLPLPHAHALIGTKHGSWLAATDSVGSVAVWDTHASQAKPLLIRWDQPVTAFTFARNRATLVLGGKFGKISAIDVAGVESKQTLVGDAHATILSIATGLRDAQVITGSSDGAVSIWDLAKCRFIGNALNRQVGISTLRLSEQGRWLIIGTVNSEVDLVDMQLRARVFSVPRAAGAFKPIGFDKNGQVWLQNAASEMSGYAVTEPSPRSILADRGNVLSVAWLPDSQHLFSGGLRDSSVCLFRIADGICLDRVPVLMSQVRVALVSPNGHYLVLAGTGNSVQIWDAQTRLPIAVSDVPIPEIRTGAFDALQMHLFVGGVANTLVKIHLDSGKVVEKWDIGGQVQAMAISNDGQALFLGLRDGRVQRRDSHLRLLREAQLHQGWVSGIGLSPTLDYGVSVGADGKTMLWSTDTLRVLDSRQDHTGRATAIAVSADGKYVVTGGDDQTLVVSAGSKPWARVALLQGHRGTIRCIAFDRTSQLLASGSDDASVRLWNMSMLSDAHSTTEAPAGRAWGLRMTGSRVAKFN